MSRLLSALRLIIPTTFLVAASATADPMFMGLGQLPARSGGVAAAVSANGQVVVGNDQVASGDQQAWYWTASTGMVALGDFPGVDVEVPPGEPGS